ncbi:LapA family protein [Jeotgalibaca caeni]|uniref:LapA family protein n=1 Tax=Jeotgalibaca caeni TaxID=3028623 RepID=UPI00237D7F4D|nr:lipopolysaccharide assembly protein LapA domain-containing protein [Jeotgalibaca caeni]MDE1548605.1 lipopolysaccharide assembly protein LapA domain-containing protein [Jeotgalibaca caeni]
MTILAVLILLLIAVLAFLNMEIVSLSLYFMDVSIPLWLIMIGATLLGMVAALMFVGARNANARDEQRRRKQDFQEKLEAKDEELQAARRETNEVANRTRRETEMALQMQQKEQEVEDLRKRMALMEESAQRDRYTSDPPVVEESNGYPNDIVIEPDSKQ